MKIKVQVFVNSEMTTVIHNLTLYVPGIMFQYVDKPTRCNATYE